MNVFAETTSHTSLIPRYIGRWLIEDSVARTSAPGTAIQVAFEGTAVFADIEGNSFWKVEVDKKEFPHLLTGPRKNHTVVSGLSQGKHILTLTRQSECMDDEIRVYSLSLNAQGIPLKAPLPGTSRRIEFIGDSYTVGYGNEALNSNDGDAFTKTNTTKSYAYILAKSFNADYQINAYSGRGLVKNFGNIVPEWTIPKLYEYTISGMAREEKSPLWDFSSWHPQVIVLFIGINDWQGAPPYPDKVTFEKTYSAFLNKLRTLHPGVRFLLLATRVWPTDSMTTNVKAVYDNEIKRGHKDVTFMEVYTENTALDGHPGIHAHEKLANEIRPVVGRLGKWLSR